jgi:hypothetical protein
MRTLDPVLAAAVSVALLVGASGAVAAQDEDDRAMDPESILLVGNSLTYGNGGVEAHVAAMAAAEEPSRELIADTWTQSGATLRDHYQASELAEGLGAFHAIRDGDHDVVVLQGDIPELVEHDIAPFVEYARLFDEEITDAGAATVFFMTWPNERLDWVDLDGIVEAHRQVETELGAKIAPVGVAMENALAERPDLAMLGLDMKHASSAGTYLAAATIYATLFDRSPEGLDYAVYITPEDAAFLQRIAWETVQDWQAGATAE